MVTKVYITATGKRITLSANAVANGARMPQARPRRA